MTEIREPRRKKDRNHIVLREGLLNIQISPVNRSTNIPQSSSLQIVYSLNNSTLNTKQHPFMSSHVGGAPRRIRLQSCITRQG
ncbi:unnamed protein product, partial [Prunus brigantina]